MSANTASSLAKLDIATITNTYAEPFPVYQVLSETGEVVDKDAIESVPTEKIVELMREIVWANTYDTRMILINRQGTLGNYAPAGGQEASQMGPLLACERSDFIVPTYRDVVVSIKHGLPIYKAFLWYRGHVVSNQYPADFQGYSPQVIVGATVAHGLGVALAKKRKGEQCVVLTYCGDGATSQGDFYEGLNFAAVYQAPMVSIVQNNLYAISVPLAAQTKSETIAQKGVAAGVTSLRVDGMDPVAMYVATKKAREYALAGKGPVLIEALTYRTGPHTMSDDPTRYRSTEEVQKWEARSPLIRLRNYLTAQGAWTEQMEQEVIDQVHAQMKEALTEMGKVPAQKVSDFLKFTFEVAPQNVAEQIAFYEAKEA